MSAAPKPAIGILGGSGIYDIDGLQDKRWARIESPFGAPSDELLFGTLGDQPMVFLPRHGRGHRIPPTEINFRANIDALKRAGVADLISVSAVLGWQSRFRWILRPGSDVYVVYTHNWLDDPLSRFTTLDRRIASKVLYTHRF